MVEASWRSRRYVVLRHEGVAQPHYDLMIETGPGEALATWRSDVWPIEGEVQLVRLGAHRRAYLAYEGPVSGNRGFVKRVESGDCRFKIEEDGAWIVRGMSYDGHGFSLLLRSIDS